MFNPGTRTDPYEIEAAIWVCQRYNSGKNTSAQIFPELFSVASTTLRSQARVGNRSGSNRGSSGRLLLGAGSDRRAAGFLSIGWGRGLYRLSATRIRRSGVPSGCRSKPATVCWIKLPRLSARRPTACCLCDRRGKPKRSRHRRRLLRPVLHLYNCVPGRRDATT
jgi:hypothetical protein